MRKRLWGVALAAVCLLGGTGAAALAAAGRGDSLVTVSYLNGTWLPALEEELQDRAGEKTKEVYAAAAARLEQIGGSLQSGGGQEGWDHSDTPQVRELKRGDVVSLSAGSTVLWTAGTASAEAGLVDATAGSDLAGGSRVPAGHRCINAKEGGSVAVRVLSDRAQALVEGDWTVAESGEDVTAFTDLSQSDWYYAAVRYAVDAKLFNGTSATLFSPGANMDRAMLATVLWRMEGEPAAAYTGAFSDVASGQWYSQSVEWAAARGIVTGLGGGRFGPRQAVTREQIAVMLYRYAKDYLELDASQAGDLSAYADQGSVSGWAREAMTWAVGAQIVNGSGGKLAPGRSATRAEVATMLQRFQSWAKR